MLMAILKAKQEYTDLCVSHLSTAQEADTRHSQQWTLCLK